MESQLVWKSLSVELVGRLSAILVPRRAHDASSLSPSPSAFAHRARLPPVCLCTSCLIMSITGVKDLGADAQEYALVSLIVKYLDNDIDRYAAALVCRVWNEVVASGAHKLVLRWPASLSSIAQRLWHITELDVTRCPIQIKDQSLAVAAKAFSRLTTLRIGDIDHPQWKVTEFGVGAFAELERLQLSSLPCFRDAGVARLLKRCSKLRGLLLENCRKLGDESLAAIGDLRELEELSLKGEFRFTSSGLEVIGFKCRGLVKLELNLWFVSIDLALKSIVNGCHKLQDVSLKFNSENLWELSRCSSLRSLVFTSNYHYEWDEAVVAIATANRNLVEFACCAPLRDSVVMAIISKCPGLQRLHLNALNITERVLPWIQQCKCLTDLALHQFCSTGRGLAEIGLCGWDVRKFLLSNARGVRDMELQMLMDGNGQLEHLDLHGCSGPTAIGYSAIALCSTLRFLDLSFTTVDDLSLISIASGVGNLKQLTIVQCEAITNMGAVTRFTSLESLILDCCSFVTDEGIDVLAGKCTRLVHLSLARTRVTDAGLEFLSKCQMLRSLSIRHCIGVRGAGVVTIAKACGWFRHVVMSHSFGGSRTADILRPLCCTVSLKK